jgi:hypothetical protein
VPWASSLDDTASYIERFHTIAMELEPNFGAGLPFTLTPTLQATTLLFSASPLVYGAGGEVDNLGNVIGSGVPPQNRPSRNYFTGRSDNFDLNQTSAIPKMHASIRRAFASQTMDSSSTHLTSTAHM